MKRRTGLPGKRNSMIMKRKPRIIPYPQTIDPAHRVMFDEFKVEIIGMANRNLALTDGTPGQVKQIIDGAELVFGVYSDNDSSDGVWKFSRGTDPTIKAELSAVREASQRSKATLSVPPGALIAVPFC
jgi:hypothetical protein